MCGGVACVLHGVDRSTHDLDLAIDWPGVSATALLDITERFQLQPLIPEPMTSVLDPERRRAWIEEKGAKVFTLRSDDGQRVVDLFLTYPIPWSELYAAATPLDGSSASSARIRISGIQHLLEAKRSVIPPRRRDLRDIEDLLVILGDGAEKTDGDGDA